MKIKGLMRTAGIAAVVLAAGTVFGGVQNVASADLKGHRSSLRATVTLADGGARTVSLEGVGCTVAMCSRVRVLDANAETVWLDGLSSVHDISPEADGVTAVLTFRDGGQRRVSIRAGNRVLYLARHFGFTEQLDLASVTKIEFRQP